MTEDGLSYQQYLNRLVEWSEDYLEYVAVRVEFEYLVDYGFTWDEAFQMVSTARMDDDQASS